MEPISEKKIHITKKILEVKDDSVLDKIAEILNETEIVAYTTDGEALNRDQYKKHIKKISKDLETKKKRYTSDEVRNYIINYNT